jgi:hypothetical protein
MSKPVRVFPKYCLLHLSLGGRNPEESVNKTLDKVETNMENDLVKTFKKFQIHASVKTDKYTLPYTDEICVTLGNESYINGVFEFDRCYREIFTKLLSTSYSKIRFYVWIEPVDGGLMGGLKYHFRYFPHSSYPIRPERVTERKELYDLQEKIKKNNFE